MRHVPVAEFKDNASHFIAAAEAGEEIVITRHGKPVVQLSSIHRQGVDLQQRQRVLEGFRQLREEMRAAGQSVTLEEAIAWKNEGRP